MIVLRKEGRIRLGLELTRRRADLDVSGFRVFKCAIRLEVAAAENDRLAGDGRSDGSVSEINTFEGLASRDGAGGETGRSWGFARGRSEVQAVELIDSQALKAPSDDGAGRKPPDHFRDIVDVKVNAVEDDVEDNDGGEKGKRRVRRWRNSPEEQTDGGGSKCGHCVKAKKDREALEVAPKSGERINYASEDCRERGEQREFGGDFRQKVRQRPIKRVFFLYNLFFCREYLLAGDDGEIG